MKTKKIYIIHQMAWNYSAEMFTVEISHYFSSRKKVNEALSNFIPDDAEDIVYDEKNTDNYTIITYKASGLKFRILMEVRDVW